MGNSSSYNKEQCQELSGNLYTEELWNEFSNNGEITRQILYVIKNSYSYTEKATSSGGTYKIISNKIIATLHKDIINAPLLTLSGETKQLSDYYSNSNSNLPLILNIGSCT